MGLWLLVCALGVVLGFDDDLEVTMLWDAIN
jgi:hypothetical protein